MDKYQCLKLISCQVFSQNCQKITWGHHGGCLTPPMPPIVEASQGLSDAPMLFLSKSKNYISNQMHSFFPRTKITWGASCAYMMPPIMGGIRGHQTIPTLLPTPTTSLTSTPHTPPPTDPTPTPIPTHPTNTLDLLKSGMFHFHTSDFTYCAIYICGGATRLVTFIFRASFRDVTFADSGLN